MGLKGGKQAEHLCQLHADDQNEMSKMVRQAKKDNPIQKYFVDRMVRFTLLKMRTIYKEVNSIADIKLIVRIRG